MLVSDIFSLHFRRSHYLVITLLIQCPLIVTEQLLRLHRGQGWDIQWRDNVICPSVDDYLNMIDDSKNCSSLIILVLSVINQQDDIHRRGQMD